MYESAYDIELRTELEGKERKIADRFHREGVSLGGSLLDCLYDHSSAIKSVMAHSKEVAGLLWHGFRLGRRKSAELSDAVIDRAFRTAQQMHGVRGGVYSDLVADLHFNDYQEALDYLTGVVEDFEDLEQVAPENAKLAKAFCYEGITMGEKALKMFYGGKLSLLNPTSTLRALNKIRNTDDPEFMDLAFPLALVTAKIMHDLFLNYHNKPRVEDLKAILHG
tara:strand:- start:744 stop:1409 length:666 start_codon:yes stop_codon:yes gene_type:complete